MYINIVKKIYIRRKKKNFLNDNNINILLIFTIEIDENDYLSWLFLQIIFVL